jgi:hypothetical protein
VLLLLEEELPLPGLLVRLMVEFATVMGFLRPLAS